MAVPFNHLFHISMLSFLLIGFLSAAPSKEGWKNTGSRFMTWPTPAPIKTTKLSARQETKMPCEIRPDTLNKTYPQAIKQGTKELMVEYMDWGKLLAPAPVVIEILGKLIIMANHEKDFPINRGNSSKIFKYIDYPESFRTTLLQISQQGYRAFLKAHSNMNAIRLHNSAIPSDIKDAVRYLASSDPNMIKLRLPAILERIKDATKRSKDLSKEVVDEFETTLYLIKETELAVMSTKSDDEKRLDSTNFDIELGESAKKFSEEEDFILEKKDAKMKELKKSLERRKNDLDFRTTYRDVSFTINLANNWVNEIGQDRYKKEKKFLHDENKKWKYTYQNEFVKNNPCAQKNSQNLLDLLIAFSDYRKSYEHWRESNLQQDSLFDGSKLISSLQSVLGNIQQCSDIDSIKAKVSNLIKMLKSPNTSQDVSSKITERPYSNEIDEITTLVDVLRTAAIDVTKSSDKRETIVTNSAWKIYALSKQYQLEQLNSMTNTIEEIIKLNNDLTEIRKQKTKQIMDRINNLNIIKIDIGQVINALKLGLEELGKLKNDWGKLILFFENIHAIIEVASRHSTGLVEIVQTVTKQPKETKLYEELLDKVEKSNEAVLLIHDIADMYTKVSDRHIMNRIIHLNTMGSMIIGGTTDEQLEQEKAKISRDTNQTSEDIAAIFNQQTKQLNEKLKTRHQEILQEYEQFFSCLVDNGLTNTAIISTGHFWFQLKSRLNEKVLEVPLGNSSIVHMRDSLIEYNQFWYLGRQDKIIRSFATDECLTSHGYYPAIVTVEPCKNQGNQKWTFKDTAIVNIENPNRCLIVHQLDKQNETHIVEYKCKRGANQIWDRPGDSPSDVRFQLMSLLNGKVLDVPSGNNSNVRMWDSRAGKTNELWYLDENKRIRSYATDACLTSNGEYPALVTVEPCKNKKNQKWMIKDKVIINVENPNRCLNVRHSDKHNGALLVEYRCHRGKNQLWNIVPVNK